MGERTLTPLRAARLADLQAMAERGDVLSWATLAAQWSLSAGAAARTATEHIPGVVVRGGLVRLPDGRTIKITDRGTRSGGPSIAERYEAALAELARLADAGEVLHLPTFAERVGYSGGATGAREMLARLPGVTVTDDAVILPDGRRVARLRESQRLSVEVRRARYLDFLRSVHASGSDLSWEAGAEALGLAGPTAFRKAVMRVASRDGDALVVPGVGRVPLAGRPPRERKAKTTSETGRRAAAPAVRTARQKPATPKAPRVSSRVTCAEAGPPASAALSERQDRVLAHLEGVVSTTMPRREDMAKALHLSVAAVRYALEILRKRGDMARVPGGWRLPSGRVLRQAMAAHVGRKVSTKRKPLPVAAPEVAGAAVKLTIVAEQVHLPAKVPPLQQWPGADECRWPIGEMRSEAGLSFCRSKTHDGASYCPYHDARAHVRQGLLEAAE